MSRGDDRPLLVTGGAGFIGCNLVDRLASAGHAVLVYDSLARPGVEANLDWLEERHGDRVTRIVADICDSETLGKAVAETEAVFHLAGQVAVTTSLADPRTDFEANLAGTFGLLEAVRTLNPEAPLVFASTNKVYGALAGIGLERTEQGYLPADSAVRAHGIAETMPLDFYTPYGCSKGAADQYVLDHARSLGLRAAVLRMSCIYGQRQLGTEDQGWVAHFLIRAIEGEPITLYGDGRQVRDICEVGDVVDAYIAAWKRIDGIAGRPFNLGGGPRNAVSLLGLLDYASELLDRELDIRFADWRAGDQRYFVADTRLADRILGLRQRTPWREGVASLACWLADRRDGRRTKTPAAAQPMEHA